MTKLSTQIDDPTEVLFFPAARDLTPRSTPESRPRTRGEGLRWLVAFALPAALGIGQFVNSLYPLAAWGTLALGVAVAVIALLFVAPVNLNARAWTALAGLGALLLVAAASMTWAPSLDRAWTETNRLALYLLILLATLLVAGRPSRARALLILLTLVLAAVPVYIVYETGVGSGAGLFVDFRLHKPVGYTNGTAGLLLLALWCSVAQAVTQRLAIVAGACLGVAALCGGLLVLTQSRAVAPAVLASALVALVMSPRRVRLAWALIVVVACSIATMPWTLDVYQQRPSAGRPDEETVQLAVLAALGLAVSAGILWASACTLGVAIRSRAVRGVLAAGAVAVPLAVVSLGFVAVGNPVPQLRSQYQAFTQLKVNEDTTNRLAEGGGYRYDLWRIAWNEFRRNPVRGVGAGSYAVDYFTDRKNPQYVRQPHSLELQLLAELGLLGALCFLVVVVGLVWAGARVTLATRAGVGAGSTGAGAYPTGVVAIAAGGGITAWFVHTSVDWLYNLPALTGVAVMLAGLLLAASGAGRSVDVPAASEPGEGIRAPVLRVVAIVLVAMIAVMAASVGRQYVADRYRIRAEQSIASDPTAAIRAADRSLAFNPGSPEAYIARAAAAARLGNYGAARSTLLAAADRERFNYVPWALLGDLAVRRGNTDQAKRAYGRASSLNPFDPALRDLAANPPAAPGA